MPCTLIPMYFIKLIFHVTLCIPMQVILGRSPYYSCCMFKTLQDPRGIPGSNIAVLIVDTDDSQVIGFRCMGITNHITYYGTINPWSHCDEKIYQVLSIANDFTSIKLPVNVFHASQFDCHDHAHRQYNHILIYTLGRVLVSLSDELWRQLEQCYLILSTEALKKVPCTCRPRTIPRLI